jgi:hypothetical protein
MPRTDPVAARTSTVRRSLALTSPASPRWSSRGSEPVSRTAIAAALARKDLVSGERIVPFSLASFAYRENRARPGTPAAGGGPDYGGAGTSLPG